MNPQIEPNLYLKRSYDFKGRFISYWHQIDELTKLGPTSILEIGIGNGLVSNYLKQRGFNITTLDSDPSLNPDTVGSVANIPFVDYSFELVACFELLEHLPYEQFTTVLTEIHRISKKYCVLSLPDASRVYRLYVQIPMIGELKQLMSLPQLKAPKHMFDGQHYWEIGKAGFHLRRILNDMERAGFCITKTYRIFEIPYHRFFVLTKLKVSSHS
jgi:predicted SAM-dependent methyltransferase